MKLLSLFSGIGAFEKALDRLNIDYDLVNYCEIDKYAAKSYALIHNCSEDKNLGDITKVDTSNLPKDIDLLTYGFPCQDISLAGNQKGFSNEDGSRTRSGLFFEALRIIEDVKPKVAIAENVKNLVSKKFKNEFEIVLQSLEEAGYNNYWQVLNAKDYGIPQNRERVFIVSIRKDIDKNGYVFPEKFPLELRLKDLLEDEVDEKYYLSDKMVDYIVANNEKWTGNNEKSLINKSVASTINTGEGTRRCDASNYVCDNLPEDFDLKCVGSLKGSGLPWDKMHNQTCKVYDPSGVCPTLDTMQGGHRQPKVLIKNKTKQGYLEAEEGDGIDISSRMQHHRGTVQKGISQTLDTQCNVVIVPLKRGYSVEIKEEQEDTTDIDVIGNYSKSNYNATVVVGKNGVAPTVRENHGQVTGVVEKEHIGVADYRYDEGLRVRKDGLCPTLPSSHLGTSSSSSSSGQPLILEEHTDKIIIVGKTKSGGQRSDIIDEEGISSCLTATDYKQPKQVLVRDGLWTETQAKMITPEGDVKRYIDSDIVDKFEEGQCADISFPNGYNKGPRVHDECPAINTTTTKNSFIVKTKNKRILQMIEDNDLSEKDPSHLDIYNQKVNYNECGTLKAGMDHQQGNIIYSMFRIRKLTPKECFRLMDFDDEDIDILIENGISNTQLYKQAGNSIVVTVLEKILENMKEIFEVKKVEEKKIISYQTDKMINLEVLMEKEPELFEELAKDYPCEDATYIYEVKKGA